jgi:O-antigen biosynthesis protein WbqP
MYPFFKRIIDIIASLGVLLALSPLLIIVAAIIYLQDFGNPIFKQQRIGQNGLPFHFYKFRSMPLNTPNVESKDRDKLTITPFGKILRRSNLDEIPQLFNILKGDMSLIGPRPSIPTQTELTEMRKANGSIHLRPGLTGWAQVNAYDFMPNEVKANFDGYYAKNISFGLDVKIVLKTLGYLTKKPPTY